MRVVTLSLPNKKSGQVVEMQSSKVLRQAQDDKHAINL